MKSTSSTWSCGIPERGPLVDRETVLARVARVEEMLRVLRAIPPVPPEQFAADPNLYLKAERCLEVMAQAVLDIASHILAERGLRKPARYSEVFQILGEGGVLAPELASRLRRLAGLRNILVHEYLAVDRVRLHEFITRELGDVDAFLGIVVGLTQAG